MEGVCMTERFLFMLFKVIWQDLMQDITFDSTKQNWQTLQAIFIKNKNNQQLRLDLTIALKKSFYSSKKMIAEKCRENLIKESTFIQYRGAKIYNPPKNDIDIKTLEKEIKLLETQLKQINKRNRNDRSLIDFNQIEEFLRQLSQSIDQKFKNDKHIGYELFAFCDNCDVGIYQSALRNEKNGLRKLMFNSFLIEIEPKEELNRIFNARTYLILNQMRNKF